MAYDDIAHCKRIEEQLNQVGHLEAADRLADARLGGATSGEILMALRSTLKELLACSAVTDSKTRSEMLQLVAHIDASGV